MSRDLVIETLWPDRDRDAAMNNLHQAVHAARRGLADGGSDGAALLGTAGDLVVLGPGAAVVVDVVRFEAAATAALRDRELPQLRAAYELWAGELLPEDTTSEWLFSHRDRLAERHVTVRVALAGALVDADSADQAIELLTPLADERPVDETLQRTLFAALAAGGRRWDALAGYELLRERLEAEYAARPEPETRALYRQLVGSGVPAAGANNLPVAVTSFVGRHRELLELEHVLGRSRLLTLTGPGGAGKTRLAIQLARRRLAAGEHHDGAWLVDLAGVRDDLGVVSVTAAAIGVTLQRDRTPAALAEQLTGVSALLVLDNCEHLLSACVALVAALLARCAALAILATSREPLSTPGEVVWRVPSLGVPAADPAADAEELATYESVQLFVERAQEAAPAFRLDHTTAAPVATICNRLDGIPLALELAAARVAHLSVAQVAERLGDALTMLAHGGRGRLDRQQTIAATLDWSYELLDGEERVLLRRLAVFAGGFDIAAAIAICGEGLDDPVAVLARLVDKSLVNADTAGEHARYELLEVVRQYAEARLGAVGELAEQRRRHREWFAVGAASRDPDRAGPVVREPSEWFDTEQDNLRAALLDALVADPPGALTIAVSTWRFWLSRGQIAEGAQWLTDVLAVCTEDSPLRRRALFGLAVFRIRRGDSDGLAKLAASIEAADAVETDPYARALGLHERSLLTFMGEDWSAAEDLIDQARSTSDAATVNATNENLAAILAIFRGDLVTADARFAAARRAADAASDDAPPFFVAMTPAWVVDDRDDVPFAVGEESMVLGRRVGAAQARAYVRISAAVASRLGGDLVTALSYLADAVERFAAVEDRYGVALALNQRGHTLRWIGDLEGARAAFRHAEEIRMRLRDPRPIAITYSGLAIVEALANSAASARELAGRSVRLMRRAGDANGLMITVADAAMVEMTIGDTDAALHWLEQVFVHRDLAGAQRGIAWLELVRGGLLERRDDLAGAALAVERSQATFMRLGEGHGLAAASRAAKRLQSPGA